MHAQQKSFNDTLSGSDKQYYCPPLQRGYQWSEHQWQTLYEDLRDAAANEQEHFFGTLILTEAVKEGKVSRHLLVDGQQRLTTLTVLLARGAKLLRIREDVSNEHMDFCAEIDKSLRNRSPQDIEHKFKVWPTAKDRDMYRAVLDGQQTAKNAPFTRLAAFLDSKFEDLGEFPSADSLSDFLKSVMDSGFTVSIEMGNEENICAVFSSINGKGCPLKSMDLLKNLILMRSKMDLTEAYEQYWKPVEQGLTDSELEKLFRKIVLANVGWCNSGTTLDRFNSHFRKSSLPDLVDTLSLWKSQFLGLKNGFPQKAFENKTMLGLERISRARGFMQDTSHLLIEGCLVMLAQDNLTEAEFRECLLAIENFAVRTSMHDRQISRDSIAVMHKVLAQTGRQAVDTLTNGLFSTPSYVAASDVRLLDVLRTKAFKSPTLKNWARYVLLGIEANHDSDLSCREPTLEHIAPNKLKGAAYWGHIPLDSEWQHQLGNLTILKQAWNEEARRCSFGEKQKYFSQSHLWLNEYFADKAEWGTQEITVRTDALLADLLKVWPYKSLTSW
jgi:hypothetical protein